MTDAQKRAKAKYQEKVRTFRIDVYPTETDILKKLTSVDKYGTYIKNLIRADIKGDEYALQNHYVGHRNGQQD